MAKVKPTGYWTFFVNPKKWEIDLSLGQYPQWGSSLINEFHTEFFQPGQLAVVRVGVDRRSLKTLAGRPRLESGIYAIYEISSYPRSRVDAGDYWLNPPDDVTSRLSVDVRIVQNLIDQPLLLENLARDPKITDKYLLNGFQASSMPLEPGTFKRIIELLGDPELLITDLLAVPTDIIEQVQKLEQLYADTKPEVRERVSQQIERGQVANTVKELNNYKCQVCEELGMDPIGFKKLDGTTYVEAHHVMPLARHTRGALGPSNIITVCANHHRQLHYGQAKLFDSEEAHFVFEIDGKQITIKKVVNTQ